MTIHVAILLLLVLIQCTSLINRRRDKPANIVISTVFTVGDSIIDCIIAAIMWLVSAP